MLRQESEWQADEELAQIRHNHAPTLWLQRAGNMINEPCRPRNEARRMTSGRADVGTTEHTLLKGGNQKVLKAALERATTQCSKLCGEQHGATLQLFWELCLLYRKP